MRLICAFLLLIISQYSYSESTLALAHELEMDSDRLTGVWVYQQTDQDFAADIIKKNVDGTYKVLSCDPRFGPSFVTLSEELPKIIFQYKHVENGGVKIVNKELFFQENSFEKMYSSVNGGYKVRTLVKNSIDDYLLDFVINECGKINKFEDGLDSLTLELKEASDRLSGLVTLDEHGIERNSLGVQLFEVKLIDHLEYSSEKQYFIFNVEIGKPRGRGTCGGATDSGFLIAEYNGVNFVRKWTLTRNQCVTYGQAQVSYVLENDIYTFKVGEYKSFPEECYHFNLTAADDWLTKCY
jgi:hypothetical protein